jgi:hypothetical protein
MKININILRIFVDKGLCDLCLFGLEYRRGSTTNEYIATEWSVSNDVHHVSEEVANSLDGSS